MCQRFLAILAVCAAALLGCSAVLAQQSKRVALTVGNEDYGSLGTLRGSKHDAERVAEALTRLGFEVISVADADRDEMRRAIGDFRARASGADIAVVFIAGYGVRLRNQPYLVPVDVTLKDGAAVEREIVPLAEVASALGQARNSVLLVDTCGSESLAAPQAPGMRSGLGRLDLATEAVAATASGRQIGCAPRRLLADSLLIDLEQPGLDARLLIRRTRNIVDQRSGGDQELAIWSSGARPFTLAPEDSASGALRRLGPEPALPALRAYKDKFRGQNAEVVRVLSRDREQQQTRPDGDQVAKAWNRWLDDAWLRKREDEARIARREALEGRFSREAEPPQIAVTLAPPPVVLPTPEPLRPTPPELKDPEIRKPPAEESQPRVDPPAIPPPSQGEQRKEPEPSPTPPKEQGEAKPFEKPPGNDRPTKPNEPSAKREPKEEPKPVEPKPVFDPKAPETIRALQTQLQRLKCYTGPIDGDHGRGTDYAISQVTKKLGHDPGLIPLTEGGLNALKEFKGDLCPPPLPRSPAVQQGPPASAPSLGIPPSQESPPNPGANKPVVPPAQPPVTASPVEPKQEQKPVKIILRN